MTTLSPLIELATQKSLDLFYRVGRGYVARISREAGQDAAARGLGPSSIQARAEARIVAALGPIPRDGQLYAWPGGTPKPAPVSPVLAGLGRR